MAMGGNNDSFMSDINVTPFVDVMLVLLIIFMVTAPMMVQGVNVTLPETSSGPLEKRDDNLVVTIDNKKQLFINDMNVSFDFLGDKIGKILEGRSSREVFLKADKDVSYGLVVSVMAELKGAGVEKLGMVTEPVKKKK